MPFQTSHRSDRGKAPGVFAKEKGGRKKKSQERGVFLLLFMLLGGIVKGERLSQKV